MIACAPLVAAGLAIAVTVGVAPDTAILPPVAPTLGPASVAIGIATNAPILARVAAAFVPPARTIGVAASLTAPFGTTLGPIAVDIGPIAIAAIGAVAFAKLPAVGTAVGSALATLVAAEIPAVGTLIAAEIPAVGTLIATIIAPVGALIPAEIAPLGTSFCTALCACFVEVYPVVTRGFGAIPPTCPATVLRPAELARRILAGALARFLSLCTTLLAGLAAVSLGGPDAFLHFARLRFGLVRQGSESHRRGEGAQRAAFH